jgi:anti-sigma factor RsiW
VACKDNELLLHAYVDGEMDLVRSLQIEEHVKTCGSCAQQLREQQTLRKGIRSANLHHHAPESLRAQIIASANAAQSAGGQQGRGGASRVHTLRNAHRRPVLEWLAVAAAILIAVAIGIRIIPGALNARQGDLVAEELVASHIRSLQPGHLMDVVSTDQHTVKPWFDGKLDFAPPVRDLADQGYPLIGGRLDYVGGRNVAALVYQLRKHFINVFVWPDDGTQSNLTDTDSRQGYNVACRSNGGMRLCGVSDVSPDDLRQFMQILLH